MTAARPALGVLLAGALSGACSAALPEPPPPAARPTRKVPPAPVRATLDGSSSDGFLTLAPPAFERVHLLAGTFTMGSSPEEIVDAIAVCAAEPLGDPELCEERGEYANEQAAHEVYLTEYWIDRTEVSVERYRTCVAGGECTDLPYAAGGARFDVPSLPAVLVTWSDARRFCRWAGGQLPSEAQWERAARGRSARSYPWGHTYNPFLANHGRLDWDELDDSDGFLELAPVGSFPDGAGEGGVLDLAGNAEEWVADWYAPSYAQASATNPKGPDAGDDRVVRGGSFTATRASIRSAARKHALPDERRTWRGFRCAYSAK